MPPNPGDGGLVEEQQLRIVEQRARHTETVLHALGVLGHQQAPVILESNLLQQRRGRLGVPP